MFSGFCLNTYLVENNIHKILLCLINLCVDQVTLNYTVIFLLM